MTFSRTVIAGNSATFWNVRPMPQAAIACWGLVSRSWPSKTIVPVYGVYRRDRQLNSVVLPAPLGPMTPQI